MTTFITMPIQNSIGLWMVFVGVVPKDKRLVDEQGNIRVVNIINQRFFKRKGNAFKFYHRTVKTGWETFVLVANNHPN